MKSSIRTALVVSAAILVACEPEPLPSAVSQPILNGDPVTTADQNGWKAATVRIGSGDCSGVLYTNQWAFTARHCIDLNRPDANSVVFPSPGGVASAVDQINLIDGVDIALLHLQVPIGGSTPFVRSLHRSIPREGEIVRCLGRGGNAFKPGGGSTGRGVWRWADLKVTEPKAVMFDTLLTNNKSLLPGDSGGPCFYSFHLSGINSAADVSCTDRTTEVTCNDTLTGVSKGHHVAIGGLASWIEALTSPGIGVFRAQYGGLGSGCNPKEVTDFVRNSCQGRQTCDFLVDHRQLGDPHFGCAKPFFVDYFCAGGPVRRTFLAAEASGKTARLSCTGINVQRATYGGNRIRSGELPADRYGNATASLDEACSGRSSCSYRIDVNQLGDPIVNKSKDFEFEYTCNGQFGVNGMVIADEANGKTITLSCP